MTSPRIRRSVAALALTAILALGAPAHAAGWESWTAPSGWIENALEWIARLWVGGGVASTAEPARIKSDQGIGIDSNGGGSSTPPTLPPATSSESGPGIDPNG